MSVLLFSLRAVRSPLAAACALACAGLSHAQTAVPSLPDTVVSATRVAQPLTDVLADVTLLDARAIQHSGAVNIADLLGRQPGVELSRNGGPGTTSSIYMRGAETRFTAVYIDGVRVDSQSTGGAPWEAMPLAQIERIEIVRGPAAAVYGSDAIAGVVQIFTRKGEDGYAPYLGLGAGSRGTYKAEAGLSGKTGAVDYALGVTQERSKGFDAKPGSNPDLDGYKSLSASARVGVQIDPQHRIEASALDSRMQAQYDGFSNKPDSYVDDWADNRLRTVGAAWVAQWTPDYKTTLSVNQSNQSYETTPSPYSTETRLRNYLFQNEWRVGSQLFTAALERREDHLTNAPIDQSRHQNALALGYGLTQGAHTLQANLRHDHDSEFGGQTTGGLAYGLAFAPGWRATAAAGTAFRVPTLYHRFSQYGQAGLAPEKGRNVELGVHWAERGSRFDATVYRNRVSNLINFGAAGSCASAYGCYENAGHAQYQGITLAAAHRVGAVNLGASVDWQKPENLDTGKLLARRAERIVKLRADTRVALGSQDWTLGAEWQAVGRRFDDAANKYALPGYGLVNLYASTSIAREWSLLARLDNLGNIAYQTARGYAQPGRTLFVGLRWSPR